MIYHGNPTRAYQFLILLRHELDQDLQDRVHSRFQITNYHALTDQNTKLWEKKRDTPVDTRI